MPAPKRLLSIGHSYVVTLNRRLVNEIARLGADDWEITTIAPSFLQGDLRPLHLELSPDEGCDLEAVQVYFSKRIHFMVYGTRLKQILQQGWDLVHSWEEPYILAGGQIARWMPNDRSFVNQTNKQQNLRLSPTTAVVSHLTQQIPLVYFTFQNHAKQYPPPFNWIEQYSMRRAAGWICSGHTIAESLKYRPGYQLPMRLIPLGVDVDHFCPSPIARQHIRRQLNWDRENPPVIGFLGRLVPQKGLELLMRALDQVRTPWRALFIGTGPLENRLRTWANRYGDGVRICTTVTHDQVAHYLNAMDLLCAPSQTTSSWREQFGRMLIEAFACGLPVIGSDSGEIPYVIQKAGIVVGEADEAGWVRAITTLLENPEQRQELGTIALHRAHTTYAWSIVAQQHLEFFTELLDKK